MFWICVLACCATHRRLPVTQSGESQHQLQLRLSYSSTASSISSVPLHSIGSLLSCIPAAALAAEKPDLLERSTGKPKIKDAATRPCHGSRPWANKSVSSVPLSSHDSWQYFEFECSNHFGHILTCSAFKFVWPSPFFQTLFISFYYMLQISVALIHWMYTYYLWTEPVSEAKTKT